MKKTIAVVLAMGSVPALAAQGPALDKVVACAAITDPSARLTCFDREVAPFVTTSSSRAASGATSSAVAPAAPPITPPAVRSPTPAAPPATPSVASSSFGQEQLPVEQRPTPKQEELTLHAHLTSQRAIGGGMFNLYLDNGQVWQHQDQVQGEYLRNGEAVTIERGALGSYKLSRDAGKSRNWIRVSRIR